MNDSNRHPTLWEDLERLAAIFCLVGIGILAIVYFFVAAQTAQTIPLQVRDFVLALIMNLIPMLLIVVVSYTLFRRILETRSTEDRAVLAGLVASSVRQSVANEFLTQSERLEEQERAMRQLTAAVERLQVEMQNQNELTKSIMNGVLTKTLPYMMRIAVGGSLEKVRTDRQPKLPSNQKSEPTRRHLESLSREVTDETD